MVVRGLIVAKRTLKFLFFEMIDYSSNLFCINWHWMTFFLKTCKYGFEHVNIHSYKTYMVKYFIALN